jgi:hypothetical protein
VYDSSLLDQSSEQAGSGGKAPTTGGSSQAGHASTAASGGEPDGSGHSGGVPIFAGSAGATAGGSSAKGGSSGASGGSSGAGGNSGSAGSLSQSGPPELIDDMEGDRNVHILKVNGRTGFWYTSKDDPSTTITDITLSPAPLLDPARSDASKVGWHVVGSGYKLWGSQLGISLKNPAGAYDASAYCGVRFFIKGTAPYVTFEVSDKYSEPLGKLCDPKATTGDRQCFDHMWGTFSVSSQWREVLVPFSSLSRKGYAIPDQALARDALFTLAITFADPTGQPFDVWVDDIFFDTKDPNTGKCAGQ